MILPFCWKNNNLQVATMPNQITAIMKARKRKRETARNEKIIYGMSTIPLLYFHGRDP